MKLIFLIFYAIFLLDVVMKVEWSFVVNGDCSHFRGFDFGEDTPFLHLKSPCE